MLIWRLEDKENRGPYRSSLREDFVLPRKTLTRLNRDNWGPYHPGGFPLIIEKKNSYNYKFGFSSLDNLKSWFRGILKPLLDIGFQINIYKVNSKSSVQDNFQVAFNSKTAKRVATNVSPRRSRQKMDSKGSKEPTIL